MNNIEEKILEVLRLSKDNGLDKEVIYKKIGFTNLDYNDFLEIFDDMKNRHLIYQTGKNSYIKNPFYEGTVVVTKKGKLLVKVENETYEVQENVFNCVTGDIVRLRIKDYENHLGTVTEVLDRRGLSAELITERKKRFALTRSGEKYPIEIPSKIVDGTIIGIKIKKDRKDKLPVAVLDKVIGHKNRPKIDEEMILYENNFDYEWNSKIVKELEFIPDVVSEDAKKGRRDLRNKTIFTIDGDDTKDIDDAISLETLENGNYLLGVHIADVSHYVKEGSEIDKEANLRATSVYMNSVVNPMYPVELSNGICSLNPEVDRLAMSCEMEIDKSGKVVNFDIFESLINSRKQMTYKNVNKILKDEEIPLGYEDYANILKEMNNLANILRKSRIKRGYQNFDLPEIKVITDDNGKPVEIAKRIQDEGEELIEQFMLAANETVATYIYLLGVPSIYRDHDIPNEEKLKKVLNIIRGYGDNIELKGKITSSSYIQKLLEEIEKTERREVYSNMVLRCLAKATYEAYNIGHFSVGIDSGKKEAYTHFTSPIRRYPDTTIHRVLKLIIHGEMEKLYDEHHKEKMINIARHSSVQEKNADKCERESNKMKTAEYMENFIGEEYDATINSFTNGGMFVTLPNLIEGRIDYEGMKDFYIYDTERELLIGEKSHNVFKIGDKVRVKLIRSDKDLREIDFELLPKSKTKVRKANYGNTK